MSNQQPPEPSNRDLREQETVVPDSAHSAFAPMEAERQASPPAIRNPATQAPPVAPVNPKAATARPATTAATPTGSTPVTIDDLRPGLRIGKYQLLGELGRGGMGAVFLARDETLGRSVAIKFLSVDSKSLTARFMNEARLTARCEHENIVVLYDVAEYGGRPYMVLEYLEGQTLDELLQRSAGEGDQPREAAVVRAVALMIPVVRALAYAHSMGIIHRDLKPANVMVTHGGAVKVLDFGVAKALAGPGTDVTPATQGVGTIPYMAPEQLADKPIDARVDIWAVGIMLHMLVIGEHPMAPLHLPQLKQLADPTRPMPQVAERHPELGPLAGIIDRCLEKQLDRRISADALLDALEQLHAVVQAQGQAQGPTQPQPPANEAPAASSDRSRIGPYTVREQIGKGGMAVVYRAHQASIDRDVAIKVMNRSLAGDPEAMTRFTREARLVARLEHPHILPIHDFDASHDPPYLVTRYLSGGTLGTLARARPLALAEIADIVSQVCSALDYAHRQGVVHRDIKPSNILLDDDGRAFVADFGIARMVGGPADKPLTALGAAIGTAEFMAPEQARGLATVDGRADIYALGIIAFQLLTGSLPFTGNYLDVLLQQAQQPAPSLQSRAADAPEALESVIAHALAKEPDERFPSAAEFDLAFQSAVVIHQAGAGVGTGGRGRYRRMPTGGDDLELTMDLSADLSASLQVTPDAQNKQVIALHMEAGAYAEMVTFQRGDDAARRALQVLLVAAQTTIEERGGVLAEYAEDNLLAVWGAQTRRENDAERALHAALAVAADARERASEFLGRDDSDSVGKDDTGVDIGVHAGVALLSASEYIDQVQVSGATIWECHRLARQAGGAVVVSQPVHNLVRGLFTMQPEPALKHRGRPGDVPVFRVLGAREGGLRVRTRGIEGVDTDIIGRDAELKTLKNAYLDAVEEGELQLITVVGEAGLGKTRLLDEFRKWLDTRTDQPILMPCRATPEMTHRPYALIREIVANNNGILDTDSPEVIQRKLEERVAHIAGPDPETAHLLGHLVGFDFDHSPFVAPLLDDPRQLNVRARQLFRGQVRRVCGRRPVMMVYEDVQHADEGTLDLIIEVAREEPDIPLLAVCLARPAFFDRRPNWGSGLDNHVRIDLRPLDRRESRSLARSILHKLPEVPKQLRDLLVARSEGNPYFMEELVRMLIDDRIIHPHSDGPWRLEEARLAQLQVPSTLRGLVQAKLDSLLPSERLVLQRAAVLGRVFHDQALLALDGADDTRVDDLNAVLDRLRDQGLIAAREVSSLPGSTEYLFGSSITREVVLETLIERQRIVYNRAASEWLIATSGERVEEYLGLIAGYYEWAGDSTAAASYLEQAGRQALELCSYREAHALFARALAMQPRSPVLGQVRLGLAKASFQLGEYTEAHAEAKTVLAEADPDREVGLAVHAYCHLAEIARRAGVWSEAREYLECAQPLARASEDDKPLALVLTELADLYWRIGEMDPAREMAEESRQLAHRLGAPVLGLKNLNTLAAVSLISGDLEQAHSLWTESLARARVLGDREQMSGMLGNLGEVARRLGDLETARDWYRQARDIDRELERPYFLFMDLSNLVFTDLALGNESDGRRALSEMLDLSPSLAGPSVKLLCVVVAGYLIAHLGQRSRGLRLLGLAGHHPAAASDDHDDINWVLNQLGLDAASPDVAEAMAAGHTLDLDQVMAELNAEFG